MLLEKYRLSSPKIILRSALESYFDLKCTIKDEDHIRVLNNQFNWWMVGETAGKDKAASTRHRNKIEAGRALNIEQRFLTAGEKDIYDTLYRELSRHSHGNLERVISEHTIKGQLSIGHKADKERVIFILNQVVSLAAITLEECLTFLEIQEMHSDEISEIKNVLNNA